MSLQFRIHLDEIIISVNSLPLIYAARFNGPTPFVKAIGRNAAGYDGRFVSEPTTQEPAVARVPAQRASRCLGNRGAFLNF